MSGTCISCRWWLSKGDRSYYGEGECHRSAPQVVASIGNRYRDGFPTNEIMTSTHARWPETMPGQACGEWKSVRPWWARALGSAAPSAKGER
jgi:hypothetical protein